MGADNFLQQPGALKEGKNPSLSHSVNVEEKTMFDVIFSIEFEDLRFFSSNAMYFFVISNIEIRSHDENYA